MDSIDETSSLKMVRRFNVSPDTVFDVFTKPKDMQIWWGSGVTFDIELRIGGRWTIVRQADGTEYTATGEYLEIERPNRLVYTYAMPQFSPNSDTISIDIAEDGEGCVMTFVQSGKDIASELNDTASGEVSESEVGWQQGFDLMEAEWKGK